MSEIQKTTNQTIKPEHDVTTSVETEPKTVSRSTSVSMPKDPAVLQQLQREIEQAQKTYGYNPNTGTVTPFEAVGFNPEDERKRREAERRLNDWKRKENAWYNAFAVLGDSLSAALGGNVWQRQPNNIGAKANADNTRLNAEQLAEDKYVHNKMQDNSAKYADTVNNLIQKYLTKTVSTDTTGGERTTTRHYPEVVEEREQAFAPRSGSASSSSSSKSSTSTSGRNSGYFMNVVYNDRSGKKQTGQYDLTKERYNKIASILENRYRKVLNEKDANGVPTSVALDLERKLIEAGVFKNKEDKWNLDALMHNGLFWNLDEDTNKQLEAATGNKLRFRTPTQSAWRPKSKEVSAEDDKSDLQ